MPPLALAAALMESVLPEPIVVPAVLAVPVPVNVRLLMVNSRSSVCDRLLAALAVSKTLTVEVGMEPVSVSVGLLTQLVPGLVVFQTEPWAPLQ